MGRDLRATRTGGRPATSGLIKGDYALSVGSPDETPPPGWEWKKLMDLARLETGHTPSRRHPEWWEGDIPWIGIRDATTNHGRKIFVTNQYTNQAGIENSSARVLPANTVCLSRTASVGYVVVMGRPMATSQDFVNWVCDSEQLDYRFLKYVLFAEKNAFLRFAHGTTHQTIYFPEVKAFHICAPDIDEQKGIANILGTLDDKIELNRQMNRTLEAMARAIFKAWFVDFEPIKAKAAGATSFRGMPQPVFDQLPDRFTDSELGPVPEGWEYVPIGDLVDVIGGGTPSTKNPDFWEDGEYAFCTPKDLSRLSAPVLLDTERHITQAGVDKISSGQLPIGTVILSSRAPIGYLALADTPVSVNQGIIAMATGEIPNSYILLWTEASMEIIESRAGGSTFAEISKKNFRPIPALRPDDTTLAEFGKLTKPLFERIASNEREAQTLAAIRDTLLPKLLSGELHVPAAVGGADGG